MTETTILTEISDGIMTVTLNRPAKLNAYTQQMGRELVAAFRQADADDEVRVVIVTGAGRAFCAGADMTADSGFFAKDGESSDPSPDDRFVTRIFECLKPVIAAINGPAVGVGITLALPMDIRIASEGTRFGFVFTRRGLVPEAGSAWFLPRIVGLSQALRWVYACAMVNADEALKAGLISEVVPPEQLLARATAIAREIADNTSPVATALSRQLMWRASAADHPDAALAVDATLNRALATSPEAKEGIAAFLEKRKPKFPGRPSRDLPPPYPWW
ncbi:enoyl-CoA hydratase-related protein [Reyranella sp. CPCC 100927]|uniref:enoyl-CoA hydratase-related protein n=1 Tax=Reyranella sp. CPCC 100927 TaxID=2599616 RepID=UPI0015B60A0B|nr:enoyl-CoA hydratase-related protein [Reyranella sp. CPCC 100927]